MHVPPASNVLAIELYLAYTRTVTTSDTDAALGGDGFTARRGYLAGTDPHDPATRLRM